MSFYGLCFLFSERKLLLFDFYLKFFDSFFFFKQLCCKASLNLFLYNISLKDNVVIKSVYSLLKLTGNIFLKLRMRILSTKTMKGKQLLIQGLLSGSFLYNFLGFCLYKYVFLLQAKQLNFLFFFNKFGVLNFYLNDLNILFFKSFYDFFGWKYNFGINVNSFFNQFLEKASLFYQGLGFFN